MPRRSEQPDRKFLRRLNHYMPRFLASQARGVRKGPFRQPDYTRANYTVFPLGWRGLHRMGGPRKRGVIIDCPQCGRRGLTCPGYRQTRQHDGEWMPTMVLHYYPPHLVGKMICCLFDSDPKQAAP